jgi:hypothetical protein
MPKGWLLTLRGYRAAAIQWIVAALLLPSILGLLGPHRLTAEEALMRDLGQSICSIRQQDVSGEGVPVPAGDHGCTLCVAGCASGCAAPAAASRLVRITFPAERPVFATAHGELTKTIHFRLAGAPPRGPPAIS